MKTAVDPLAAEQQFFTSLISADLHALEQIFAKDFLLIDEMSGSEVTRGAFMDVLRSGMLKFETIEAMEKRVRLYDNTAIVTGRTHMSGHLNGQSFALTSRYTHVYVEHHGRWQLVSAQGTKVAPD